MRFEEIEHIFESKVILISQIKKILMPMLIDLKNLILAGFLDFKATKIKTFL